MSELLNSLKCFDDSVQQMIEDQMEYHKAMGSCDPKADAYSSINIAALEDYYCAFDKMYQPSVLYAVEMVSVPSQNGQVSNATGGRV